VIVCVPPELADPIATPPACALAPSVVAAEIVATAIEGVDELASGPLEVSVIAPPCVVSNVPEIVPPVTPSVVAAVAEPSPIAPDACAVPDPVVAVKAVAVIEPFAPFASRSNEPSAVSRSFGPLPPIEPVSDVRAMSPPDPCVVVSVV
jgi:hypothetical protein